MLTLEPLPMAEAQAFWADKVRLGPGEFAKLTDEAKVKAFAVSGIARGSELETVFTAMFRAIAQGTTLEEFKAECADIFERRGWTGKRAWRIDNIFRTNIQTAYNVGQYKQLMDDQAIFPIWQYSAINDSRTRPTHRAMDGRAWPANHPMWDVWFPPNGYRCRCSVIGLTAKQAERRGIKVENVDPTNTLVEPTDPLTGNRMPARQLLPDPGFNTNPGKIVYGGMVDAESSLQLHQVPNLPGPDRYRLPAAMHLKGLDPLPELLPNLDELKRQGMSNSAAAAYYLEEFRSAFALGESGEAVAEVAGEPVIVSDRLVTGKGGRNKITKGDRGQYIPLFAQTMADPDEIWLSTQVDDAGKVVLRRRHLSFFRGADGNVAVFSVLDIDRGRWVGVTMYGVADDPEWKGDGMSAGEKLDNPVNGYRRGVLLYRKKK
jgi:SPP1 gp7 family putative phage head morphogenesis protein